MLHILVKKGTQKEIDRLSGQLSDITTAHYIRKKMKKIRIHKKKIAFVRQETPNPSKVPSADEHHIIEIPSWTFEEIRKFEHPISESYRQIVGLNMTNEGHKTFTDTNPFVLIKKKEKSGDKTVVSWYLKPTGENQLQMAEYKGYNKNTKMLLPIDNNYVYKLEKGKTYGVLVGLNTLVVLRLESLRLPELPVDNSETTESKILKRCKSGPIESSKVKLLPRYYSEVIIKTVDI